MHTEAKNRGKLNILFFATIWVFFSLNAKSLQVPNADLVRWGMLAVLFFAGIRRGRAYLPPFLMIYAVAIIPSLLTSINQPTSVSKFFSFLFLGLCFFVYFNSMSTKENMEILIISAMWVIVIFEILSVIFIAIGQGFDGDRANGITTNSNTLGIYSNLALLSAFYLYEKKKAKWFLAIMALSVATAIMCGSRTAFISLALNIVLITYIRNKGRAAMFLAVGVFVIVALLISSGKIHFQATDRLLVSDETGATGWRRKLYWEAAISVWRRYPIFGCGYTVSGPLNYVDPGYPFHNSYLSILAETGIWGVTFLLIGTVGKLVRFFKIAFYDVRENTITIVVIVSMMMVEMLLAACSESFLFAVGSTEGCMFWMLFFWSAVYCRNIRRWEQDEEHELLK